MYIITVLSIGLFPIFREYFFRDLPQCRVWLRAHDDIFVGENERWHGSQPVFTREVDIGGYGGVICRVLQYLGKMLIIEANLLRDLLQYGNSIN